MVRLELDWGPRLLMPIWRSGCQVDVNIPTSWLEKRFSCRNPWVSQRTTSYQWLGFPYHSISMWTYCRVINNLFPNLLLMPIFWHWGLVNSSWPSPMGHQLQGFDLSILYIMQPEIHRVSPAIARIYTYIYIHIYTYIYTYIYIYIYICIYIYT
jgi:hypothetical protein